MGRIKSSGTISINDIRNEFGASGSPDLAEYRRGGVNATRVHSYGSGHNTNVGTSQVSLSQFYNAHRGWHLTCGVLGAGTSFEWRGYSNGQTLTAFGSINPTNYRGATIRGMYRAQATFKGSTTRSMVIILSGYRARNWFNRYVDPNGTYYTGAAAWSPNSTSTTWSWTVPNFGSYANGAVLSPETPQ
tara:strand:- start:858 stop:1421 length:564 start_codon:yes stop_codon:yes gene_type:complete